MITAHQLLKELHEVCNFQSREAPNKVASNSELRRWIVQRSVLFNNEPVEPNEEIDFPLFSVVLHPKSDKHRTTLL